MAKRYYLRFLIRNQSEDLLCEVRQGESSRLSSILDDVEWPFDTTRFFRFNTVDGRSVAVNLSDVQAVRFLWDPTPLPPDTTRDDGEILISLRGRREPLKTYTDWPEQLAELFRDLELGPDLVAFPKFDDEDGEPLQLNAREIVWITAPAHIVEVDDLEGDP